VLPPGFTTRARAQKHNGLFLMNFKKYHDSKKKSMTIFNGGNNGYPQKTYYGNE